MQKARALHDLNKRHWEPDILLVVVFKLIEYKIPLDRINVLKYDNGELACRQIGSGQRIEVTGNLSATCENKALFC